MRMLKWAQANNLVNMHTYYIFTFSLQLKKLTDHHYKIRKHFLYHWVWPEFSSMGSHQQQLCNENEKSGLWTTEQLQRDPTEILAWQQRRGRRVTGQYKNVLVVHLHLLEGSVLPKCSPSHHWSSLPLTIPSPLYWPTSLVDMILRPQRRTGQ